MTTPAISLQRQADGSCEIRLSGVWTLGALAPRLARIQAQLGRHAREPAASWNTLGITALDSAGALLLWRTWGRALPARLVAGAEHKVIFARLEHVPAQQERGAAWRWDWLAFLGRRGLSFAGYVAGIVELVGQLALDALYLLRHPREIPWREISANVFKSGVGAMPVTALVGFLIGVVLSYLSALQLKQFGADVFIINILGIGILREMGPVLVAVLVAGRSGSAMTAQLGVMRVTEEMDALAAMGVSHSLRLVLPKVVALSLTMPLLVLWTSAIALIGGMLSASIELDIAHGFFIDTLPKVVPIANLWIGLAKGLAFGTIVAVIACVYGLRVVPNTESLSAHTTASVVTAITAVIMVDAFFAIALRQVGLPFR